MTPAELKERRRDRQLRKEWLKQRRLTEIERLRDGISGMYNIKPLFPNAASTIDLAVDAMWLMINDLQKQAGTI